MTTLARPRTVEAWAASGAMALTGRAHGSPLTPPAPLVPRLERVGEALGIEAMPLLGERAAVLGLTRNARISCGGSTRLVPAGDGWLAVALVRPVDVDAVPAWLEADVAPGREWEAIEEVAPRSGAAVLAERAALLEIPVSVLGERPPPEWATAAHLPVRRERTGDAPPAPIAGAVVADLSGLWAGPLCGNLLHLAGATVLKVESTRRPDGARWGHPEFFDLLNGGKFGVALDLASETGRRTLFELVERADVVIESSRPRALDQLGITRRGPKVWVSITGYGLTGAGSTRVAFGDDAAVAGGLVAWDGDEPCFLADAVADPCTGLVAAAAATAALREEGRWLIDVAMAEVAAWLAGRPLEPADAVDVAQPRARPITRRAPGLGEHTDEVLVRLGMR